MKAVVKILLLSALVLALAAPLSAAQKKKQKKPRPPRPIAAATALLKKVGATAEQLEKVKKLNEKLAPKLQAAQAKVDSILTKKVMKARAEAAKKAKAEGKKGKEARAAIEAATNLTREQKATLKKAQAELAKLKKEYREAVLGLLTAEQKAKLPKKAAKKPDKKKDGKKNERRRKKRPA